MQSTWPPHVVPMMNDATFVSTRKLPWPIECDARFPISLMLWSSEAAINASDCSGNSLRSVLQSGHHPAREVAAVPIVHQTEIVGALLVRGRACTPYIAPRYRGCGLGDRVTYALIAENTRVWLPPQSNMTNYLVERGFAVEGAKSEVLSLVPPSLRSDLRDAASACVIDSRGFVLLGHRKTSPWRHYWAFPGGGTDCGESAEQTAKRELREETEVHLGGARPLFSTTVYVATAPYGHKGYRVVNFAFRVDGRPRAIESDEMTPRWVSLAEATRLRPMAAGTRRVLRRLEQQRSNVILKSR